MSTVTATRTAPKPTAPAPVAPAATVEPITPTADDMRAALAAASISGTVSATATATLKSVTLARYTVHAARYVKRHAGVNILPDNHRRDVAALLWLEATGSITAPKSADRTPGERSLGQYVSRFGTVATDLASGVDMLADVESADAAYQAISDEKAADNAAAALRALNVWRESIPTEDRDALSRAFTLLTTGEGSTHAAAYMATVRDMLAAQK